MTNSRLFVNVTSFRFPRRELMFMFVYLERSHALCACGRSSNRAGPPSDRRDRDYSICWDYECKIVRDWTWLICSRSVLDNGDISSQFCWTFGVAWWRVALSSGPDYLSVAVWVAWLVSVDCLMAFAVRSRSLKSCRCRNCSQWRLSTQSTWQDLEISQFSAHQAQPFRCICIPRCSANRRDRSQMAL